MSAISPQGVEVVGALDPNSFLPWVNAGSQALDSISKIGKKDDPVIIEQKLPAWVLPAGIGVVGLLAIGIFAKSRK